MSHPGSPSPSPPSPTEAGPAWQGVWTPALLAVGLGVVFATFRDYGITWDEPVQSHYGEGVLRYFASGLRDDSVNEFLHMRFYGPLFELVAAIAYAPFPDAKYEIRHLLIGLSALAAVAGVLRFGTRLPGAWTMVFAPLALVALPRFYGHAFNNSKDVPFAAAFVWAVLAISKLVLDPPREDGRDRPSPAPALLCGAALGTTLSLRPGGLPMLAGIFGTAVVWRIVTRGRDAGLPRLIRESAIAWGLAWIAMVALWPWAHENPIAHPVRAVIAALSFPDVFPVLFEGEITRSDQLPRYYLAKYLWIATPPSLLLLAAMGLGVVAHRCWRAPRDPRSGAGVLVAAWLLAPLALATLSRPNVYDGMRHLLFALPALALLAGLGASTAVELLRRAGQPAQVPGPTLRVVVPGAVAALVLLPLGSHLALHPYQSTYFNVFVGGLPGAAGRYETDYWLSSYKEGIEWVNARAREKEGGVTVLVAADPYSAECAGHFLAPGVEMVRTTSQSQPGGLPEPFDYYLGTTRYGLDRNFPEAPVAHRIGRQGATFAIVRGRSLPKRGLSSASPAEGGLEMASAPGASR